MHNSNLLTGLNFLQQEIEPKEYQRGDWENFFSDLLEVSRQHKFALYNFCVVNNFKLIEKDSADEVKYLVRYPSTEQQAKADGLPWVPELKGKIMKIDVEKKCIDQENGVPVTDMLAFIDAKTFDICVMERSLLEYKLNQFDLATLIMHEIMHYALGHLTDYESLEKRLNKQDYDMILNQKIQNYIHDSLINSSLCKRFKFDPKMCDIWTKLYPDETKFPINILRPNSIMPSMEDQDIYDDLYSANSASFYEIRAMLENWFDENDLIEECPMPMAGGHGKSQGEPEPSDSDADSESNGESDSKSGSSGKSTTSDGSAGKNKDQSDQNADDSSDSDEESDDDNSASGSDEDSDEESDDNSNSSSGGKSDEDSDEESDGNSGSESDDDSDEESDDNSDGESDDDSDEDSDNDSNQKNQLAEERLRQSISNVVQEIVDGVESYDDDASDQIKNPGDSHRKNDDHYEDIDVEKSIEEQGEPTDQGEHMSSNRLGKAGGHIGIFLQTLKDFINRIEASDFYDNLVWYASPVTLGQSMNVDFLRMKKDWVGRGVVPNSHDRRWPVYKLLGIKKPFYVKPTPEDDFKVYAYVDVSPSTRDWHRSFLSAIKFNFDYFEKVFGFSTFVNEITYDNLQSGKYTQGGGTSDCWAKHMIDNGIDKAVIFTDGEFYGDWKNELPEGCELLVVYTDPGWSSYYFKDMRGVRQGYTITSGGRFKKIDHTIATGWKPRNY